MYKHKFVHLVTLVAVILSTLVMPLVYAQQVNAAADKFVEQQSDRAGSESWTLILPFVKEIVKAIVVDLIAKGLVWGAKELYTFLGHFRVEVYAYKWNTKVSWCSAYKNPNSISGYGSAKLLKDGKLLYSFSSPVVTVCR